MFNKCQVSITIYFHMAYVYSNISQCIYTIFRNTMQSMIPAHFEVKYYFSCSLMWE